MDGRLSNKQTNERTNRLFSFYDLIIKRINMDQRFKELKIFIKREI